MIKYIENLIAWGDQLFRRDTIESINEATQLYVLAARILGPRPASIPRGGTVPAGYLELAYSPGQGLDDFSNAWVELEDAGIATGFGASSLGSRGDSSATTPPRGLYFCIPPNSGIEDLWATVDDRLFKIRHCRNIEGIERRLPLFEPPIDPALLVKAIAAGLDIGDVLADLSAPSPPYRFPVMLQKALEACSEIKSRGAGLLAALEKKDAEALALTRSAYEIYLLELSDAIRQKQIEEAEATQGGLKESRKTAEERYRFYQALLGKSEIAVPEEGQVSTLEATLLSLAKMGLDSDTTGLGITQTEALQLMLLRIGRQIALGSGVASRDAGVLLAAGGILSALPRGSSPGPILGNIGAALTGAGHAANAFAAYLNALSVQTASEAGMKGIIAGYERRRDDWIFQSNMALRELQQIDKQIAAAKIRVAIATKERENLQKQVEQLREIDDFMKWKFTNQELYRWMSAQLSSLHFRSYQLAYDLAKRAERAFRLELGVDYSEPTCIGFGYWDSLKKGLLAGENLGLALRRLEAAYLERNRRELEITRHVSLRLHDPLSLLELKETGKCEVRLPEVLFDADFPGHYFRRIRSVGLSIPCVVGPYTSVNGTLTLLSSRIRIKADSGGAQDYEEGEDDPRFRYDHGRIEAIVTSHGKNDSGLFELNLHDDRYLPFEGVGTISAWRIELPKETNAFDLDSISDVVLTLRYTARDGGAGLRAGALAARRNLLTDIKDMNPPPRRHFSIRHEFPEQWASLISAGDGRDRQIALPITTEHFSVLFRDETIEITRATLYARLGSTTASPPGVEVTKDNQPVRLVWAPPPFASASLIQEAAFPLTTGYTVAASTPLKFKVLAGPESPSLEDLLLLVTYTVTSSSP